MKNRIPPFEIFCWSLSICSMLAYIFVNRIESLVFTKAFTILPLAVLALRYAGENPQRRHQYIIAGLAFGTAGDVYLTAPDRIYLVSGVICFLTGHLFYIAAFFRMKRFNPVLAAPLAAMGIAVSLIIADYIAINSDYVLGITAIAYVMVILVMAYFGISTGIPILRWGSVLFVFSDALLSYNIFITSVPVISLVLWLAYYGAQSLFTLSVRHGEPQSA